MDTRSPTREERVVFLRERDGDFCMHPDCDKTLDFTINPNKDPGPFAVTIDHWMPQVHGGGHEYENLKLMHRRCNQLKGDMIPHEDGTLPARTPKTFRRRVEKRADRPDLCTTCKSGRLLGYQETCEDCGSGPQPSAAPTLYQLRPKECPHSGPWHCWMCFLGMIQREPAFSNVLDGDYYDE